MATHTDFQNSAKRLLGEKLYNNLAGIGYTPHDFCREIAQNNFIGTLEESKTKDADLELIKAVAKNLWTGDGVTGLER
ncbi:hypothetical protein [Rheinheimera sp.]|uniref:hypothetical protein n=1 Tax=Rheinheimera sp. TaxID=1869214 RepID=UPI00404780DB